MSGGISRAEKSAAADETLSSAARTLRVQDGDLPAAPTQNSEGDPEVTAALAGSTFAATGLGSNDRQQSPRRSKRQSPVSQRTYSDAADAVRQRIDARADAAPAEQRHSGKSASSRDKVSSEDGGQADANTFADTGIAWRSTEFSTAASEAEALAAVEAKPTVRQRQPATQPILYFGAAQAQGEREYFEDRYALQTELQPGPPVSGAIDGTPDGKAEAASGLRCCYAGVFDGHSSADAAQLAARRLHVLLAGELGACHSKDGGLDQTAVEAALVRTFAAMDFEILADERRTNSGGGTTACVALQLGAALYVAHAGDSIAVLDRGGKAEKLTAASGHKVDDPVEAKRIRAKGGIVMDGGQRVVSSSGRRSLNMSRSLGDPDYKTPHRIVSSRPDVRTVTLRRQDTALILGTDGLFDVMSEADAISIVSHAQGGNAELKAAAMGEAAASLAKSAADALVTDAVRRGTTDNVTAVVALLRWPAVIS